MPKTSLSLAIGNNSMITTMNSNSNQVQTYSSSRFIRALALGCLLISALLLVSSLAAHSAPKNTKPFRAFDAVSSVPLTIHHSELSH